MENWRFTMYSIKRMIWICLLLPMSLAAQEKPVLSLDTIIQRIDRHHPMLQIYDLKAGSYKHAAEAATAWMAPMAGVGTFMTPYPGQTLMAGDDRGSLMFQLEQDIPSLAKLNARREYIGSKADAETESRSIALNTYRTQAKKLYFSWLIARERMAILENNERILQTMHKIEEIRYPFNRSKLSDVYLTESKIEENRNMVLMQKAEIEQARALLNSLMNEQIDTEFEIDTLYRPEFVPATATDTGSLASHRSDIRKMDYGIRSAQLNMESVKLQNRPDFSLRLDHMSPLTGMMPQAFSVMGMISIPIAPWSAKGYRSELKSLQYEVQAMEKERSAMLSESQGMLYGLFYEIRSAQKRLSSMETKIIPALQKAMGVNMLSYRENRLELPEVIGSWEALNMMQLNALDEKLKLYLMIADYEKELYR